MGVLTQAQAKNDQRLTHPAAADLMRVLATASVGWFHIWQQSWVGGARLDYWPRSGAVWVDVLILLSAFCLYLPYANAEAAGQPLPAPEPLAFYRRRAVRIYPAYLVSLLFALVLAVTERGFDTALGVDLLAHLTLTQMFSMRTYLFTSLNGVTWTLTVFALFYLAFPFLVPALHSRPVLTLAALLGVQAGYTAWLLPRYEVDPAFPALFNQFPAFCGVLAVGLAGAMAFARLGRAEWAQHPAIKVLFTGLGLGALVGITRLLRLFAGSAEIQRLQLLWRMPLALLACGCVVLCGLGVAIPFRRLWALLAGCSYSFYLWHQLLAVFIKYRLRLPHWVGDTPPNQLWDREWMSRYNAIAWGAALAAAVLSTYLVEKPAARLLNPKTGKNPAKRAAYAAKTQGKS